MKPGPNLTARDKIFILSYLRHLNKVQAAKDAGAKSARGHGLESTAARMYNKPVVRTYIEGVLRQMERDSVATAERTLKEVERLAMVDVAQAFEDSGQFKRIQDIDESTRRAIAYVEVETLWEGKGESREAIGTLHKVRFWDKPKCLEMLCRYLKLWVDAGQSATGKPDDPIHTVSKVDLSWADEATLRKLAEGGQ